MKTKEKMNISHCSTCNARPLVISVVACMVEVENCRADAVCVIETAATRARAVEDQSMLIDVFLKRDLLFPAFVLGSVFLRCRFSRVKKNSPIRKEAPAAANNHRKMFVWRTSARLNRDFVAVGEGPADNVVLLP